MITVFRKFFQSRIGLILTLAFVVLIGLAFASMDVSSSATFGGVAGGNRVAVVGDDKIGAADLDQSVKNNFDRAREQNPTLSMQAFLANSGLEQTLEGLIDRVAIAGFAEKYGLRAGDNLVNSEIQRIPGFRGPDGNFSDEVYQQALRQNGLNDAMFREDARQGLLAQQILIPVSLGARVPDALARRYVTLLKERRTGNIALVPSEAFLPEGNPSEAKLSSYYQSNRSDYIRPERRIIRYASFGTEALSDNIDPTDAEIAARYKRDSAQYAASEVRDITQLIVPTEAAANSIRQQVQTGGSLESAAAEAGFTATRLQDVSRENVQNSASAPVAKAVFAATRGSVAAPARSGLGWHVVRVDAVDRVAARSLALARGEITTALREEKRRQAINDLAARIEEEVDEGIALSEIAKGIAVELQKTRPVLATGQIYDARETAPPVLAPVLANAFEMIEGEPQMSEITRGETFLIYEVSEITPSATAPLKEIREQVVRDWRIAEGSAAARKAADRILARVAKGRTLAAAMSAEKTRLPPLEAVNRSREQLAEQGQRVPPALALMFSMARETAKKLEAPQSAGWFVVSLDDIQTGEVANDDPIFASVTQQLSQSMGQEYIDQLRRAMRVELGIERNEQAIDAVAEQLRGGS